MMADRGRRPARQTSAGPTTANLPRRRAGRCTDTAAGHAWPVHLKARSARRLALEPGRTRAWERRGGTGHGSPAAGRRAWVSAGPRRTRRDGRLRIGAGSLARPVQTLKSDAIQRSSGPPAAATTAARPPPPRRDRVLTSQGERCRAARRDRPGGGLLR